MESEDTTKTLEQIQSIYYCFWVIFRHLFRRSNDEKFKKEKQSTPKVHTRYHKPHVHERQIFRRTFTTHDVELSDFKIFALFFRVFSVDLVLI